MSTHVSHFSASIHSFTMLFLFVALLCGGTPFVTAAPPGGGAGGAGAKQAHDGEKGDHAVADVEISNKCDVASLSGLIQGNQQDAIPFCAHLGAKIVTVTVTSTSTSTRIQTEYTTTTEAGGMGNRKVKARAAEVTPAPKVVLVGRDGAVVEALEKCPQSAVGAACKGSNNQRILTTTTTTKPKKATLTSKKTVTVTETAPAFRIYSELVLDKRKRSTDEEPSKWYWEQYPYIPQNIRLTTDKNAAAVFNLDYSTPGYLGSLTQFSTSNVEGFIDVLLYAFNDERPEAALWFQPMEYGIAYGWTTVKWKVDYLAKTITIVDPLNFYLFYCTSFTEEYWVYFNYEPVLETQTDCVRVDLNLKIEVI
ncbi:hypothetical protein V8F06_005294 [Rhypophila decipiens]